MTALTKYRHVFLVGLQSNLVYRWNFLIRGFFSLARLAVVFILWGAAYAGVAQIGGYSLGQTFTYFTALIALQFMIGAFNEDYQIGEEIRNGLINQFLLKPINYYLYRFTVFLAARARLGRAGPRAAARHLSRCCAPTSRSPANSGARSCSVPGARCWRRCSSSPSPSASDCSRSGSWRSRASSSSPSPPRRCSAARSSRSTCCRPRSSTPRSCCRSTT